MLLRTIRWSFRSPLYPDWSVVTRKTGRNLPVNELASYQAGEFWMDLQNGLVRSLKAVSVARFSVRVNDRD